MASSDERVSHAWFANGPGVPANFGSGVFATQRRAPRRAYRSRPHAHCRSPHGPACSNLSSLPDLLPPPGQRFAAMAAALRPAPAAAPTASMTPRVRFAGRAPDLAQSVSALRGFGVGDWLLTWVAIPWRATSHRPSPAQPRRVGPALLDPYYPCPPRRVCSSLRPSPAAGVAERKRWRRLRVFPAAVEFNLKLIVLGSPHPIRHGGAARVLCMRRRTWLRVRHNIVFARTIPMDLSPGGLSSGPSNETALAPVRD